MTVGDLATLLTESGVVDLVARPVDSSMGYTAGIMAELSAVSRYGTDKSGYLHLDYATGDYSVAKARWVEDGSTLGNKIVYELGPRKDVEHWRGNITATETTPVNLSAYLALEMASREKFGASATIRVYDSEGDESSARPLFHQLWKTEVVLRDDARQLLYLTPAATNSTTSFAPFDDYDKGDTISVNTGTVTGNPVVNGKQRIYGFDIDTDTEGVERVGELICSADGE
jgi:hypothetical protein